MSTNPRLEQIDRFLCFYGRVSREMLVESLGISTATASRSLKEYCDRHPNRMKLLSGQNGGYRAIGDIVPLADYDAEAALQLIGNGTITSTIQLATYGPKQPSLKRSRLQTDIVAPITRSIVGSSKASIVYTSGSSGNTERVVHPSYVFLGANAWYFRAFDEKSSEYRTFKFSRVTEAYDCGQEASKIEDIDWEKAVTLTIMPHDKHPHPEAHALDIGVKSGCVQNIQTNAVIVGFLLNDLRVDCSLHGTLNPFEYPFRLINPQELSGIGSMQIAPGYTN